MGVIVCPEIGKSVLGPVLVEEEHNGSRYSENEDGWSGIPIRETNLLVRQ